MERARDAICGQRLESSTTVSTTTSSSATTTMTSKVKYNARPSLGGRSAMSGSGVTTSPDANARTLTQQGSKSSARLKRHAVPGHTRPRHTASPRHESENFELHSPHPTREKTKTVGRTSDFPRLIRRDERTNENVPIPFQ